MERAIMLSTLLEQSKETDVPDAFVLQNGKLLKVNMAAAGGQVLTKAGGLTPLGSKANIKVFREQCGRRPSEALGGELEQQSEGIPVSRYGVLACAELL